MVRRYLPVFLGIVLLALSVGAIERGFFSCAPPSKMPATYPETFEQASDYYATGAKREFFFFLYLLESEAARQWYSLAVDTYTHALSIEPAHRDALTNRANAYISLEEFDKALEDYRTVLEINSGDQHARLGIARAYEKSGRLELAILHYEEAIQFMKGSGYWTYFYPERIEEYQARLENLQEIAQKQ